jgi:osmoprotectant transport system substrate-binding protein
MRRIRLGSAAAAVCLALLVAACGGGDDALQGGNQSGGGQSSVIVGSTNFPEQLILAQMYAAVLEKAGIDVTTRLNLGNREVVFPALEKGEIQLLPEYNGSVLSFLDPKATATTTEEVNSALAPLLQAKNLVALDASPAEDKDGWAVTQETATKYNLRTLDDLKPVAGQLVVGGPAELKTRPAGLPGLKKVYGIPDFKEFKALDPGGPLTIDPVKNALNALSAKITTEELTKLNKQVDVDKKDPEQVARDWLTQQGLI